MRTKSLLIGLVIAAVACILVAPALAAKLGWPTWVVYLAVGIDGLLLADVPYQFSEYFASSSLHQRGYGEFAGGKGSSCLIFLIFGILPVLFTVWLVWQYLSM